MKMPFFGTIGITIIASMVMTHYGRSYRNSVPGISTVATYKSSKNDEVAIHYRRKTFSTYGLRSKFTDD